MNTGDKVVFTDGSIQTVVRVVEYATVAPDANGKTPAHHKLIVLSRGGVYTPESIAKRTK